MRRIPFARVVCDGNEESYVREVLRSGWLTTAGRAQEFETRFSQAVGAPYACAVNSCTAALHLALEALGIEHGDKVLVPTWTFTATAEVVRYLGADPVFLDVDYGSSLLTPEIVADGLDRHPDAKVLMVVHFGGQTVEMMRPDGGGVLDLCRRRGVRVVEDAAHAFPASRGGRPVGSFGDITCFSFYANKTITTGEGGMLVTADEDLWRRAKVMRLHGIDRDVWNRFTSDKPSWEYDVVAPGYKYNMPDVNAAIGLAQLECAAEFRRQRERCARFYLESLADCPEIDLPVISVPFADHAWHLFSIVLKPSARLDRNRFIEAMAAHDIGTSVHYKPVHRLSYYAGRYGLSAADFPNAERIWQGCVSLPIYPSLTDEELAYVVEVIRKLLADGAPVPGLSLTDRRDEPGADADPAPTAVSPVVPGDGEPGRLSKRIGLSVPHLSGREIEYVQEAFASNWVSTVGPHLTALEREFERRVGLPSLALASGTAAIQLGLRLLGVGPGDEVVVPTCTFVASCNPVVYQGATPVFVDSDPGTWNLDPGLLAEFLERRARINRLPKAVVAVHLFGLSADMDRILEACRPYGVLVLEDAAEAMGGLYRGRPVGTLGDVGAFSFNGNKVITASSGGMLVTRNPAWIQEARHWSTQACDPNPERNYLHTQMGYNYRLSNVLAGVALGQIEVLEERVKRRRAIAFRYRDGFADLPGITLMPQPDYAYHTNWLSCFLVDEARFGVSAPALVRHLDAANIEARPVWKPMHTQPLYRACECIGGAVAEDLNRRGICLPSSSCLTEEEQAFVIERVRAAHYGNL